MKIIEKHADCNFFFDSYIKLHACSPYWCSFPTDVPGISFHSSGSALPLTQMGHCCCELSTCTLSLFQAGTKPRCPWMRQRSMMGTPAPRILFILTQKTTLARNWWVSLCVQSQLKMRFQPQSVYARADELRSLKLCLLCTACWQIHSEGWLWEGRHSGAHSQEWGDAGADQAGGWWTVVRKRPQRNLQGIKTDILAAVMHLYVRSCRLVRNLSTSKEGLITAANLLSLIGKSKSCQSLTSSGR